MITVTRTDPTTFQVTVETDTTSHHTVTLMPEVFTRLAKGRASEEALIKVSFEFLLEREPNTSILGAFELEVIGRYFPEYEEELKRRL